MWCIPLCPWKQIVSWKDDCPWTHDSLFFTHTRSRKWISFFQCNGKVGCCVGFAVLILRWYDCSKCVLMICFQKFIDYVGELLQAFVDRREQVRILLYINIKRDCLSYSHLLVSKLLGSAWVFCYSMELHYLCTLNYYEPKE